MANPPFNVNKVDKKSDYVKTDNRLFAEVGIPKADNGNYLWIQYFYHYLNEQGRAGFVMASSATDAGNSEKAIRQRLIETGGVDCIVAVGNNFFYTRSLPCHVWFLDKGKTAQNKDKILMIDARNTSRKVNTTLNDFSTGQLGNFSAIMQAYRGDKQAIAKARKALQKQSNKQAQELITGVNTLRQQSQKILKDHALETLDFKTAEPDTSQILNIAEQTDYTACEALVIQFEQPAQQLSALVEQYQTALAVDKKTMLATEKKTKKKDTEQRKQLDAKAKLLRELSAAFKEYQNLFTQSSVGEPLQDYKQSLNDWNDLQSHFLDDQYQDIEGLCKVVDLEEVKENDYSLTPGRYVGYSIKIDMDFDYQGRMAEIHQELAGLNDTANGLMRQIQGGL